MKRLINRYPPRSAGILLALLPFVLVLAAYLFASQSRLEVNPNDKLLPSPTTLAESFSRLATEPNKRSGVIVLWGDTIASLKRLLLGVGISALIGLGVALMIGTIPLIQSTLTTFVAAVSMVPPLALLPILFIVFGLGEVAKVVLITIGITPFLIRDLSRRIGELPTEQLVKAQTLSASTWQIMLRVVLPQTLPRLIDAIRLSLGAAWIFLIAAEAIAATDGLGYRIFLVRRYLDMATIIPYVVWITLLAFLIDRLLLFVRRTFFPWQAGDA